MLIAQCWETSMELKEVRKVHLTVFLLRPRALCLECSVFTLCNGNNFAVSCSALVTLITLITLVTLITLIRRSGHWVITGDQTPLQGLITAAHSDKSLITDK